MTETIPTTPTACTASCAPVTVVIDGKPVAKGRPRVTRGGIAYTPAQTKKFEAHARLAAQLAMDGRPPLDGALALTVEAVLPVPKGWPKAKTRAALAGALRPTTRPDTDNYLKSAADALDGIVWNDDAQVVEVQARKVYGDDPRLVITVAPWNAEVRA